MKDKLLQSLEAYGVEVDEALDRFMNDAEMYRKYIVRFPGEEHMDQLKDAVEKKDYIGTEYAIHALKGMADNLGFVDFVDLAADMLYELRKGDKDAGLDLYEQIEENYKELCNVIRANA